MKRLYFIRHGLTELNVAGVWAGLTETPLTDKGRAQAKAAGKLVKDFHIDAIVSSPLERAVETAQIIAREIGYPVKKVHVNHYFIERDFGQLEGKPYNPDLDLDGFSDVETFDTLIERARLGTRWLETLGAENILIVSHGGFGRAIRALHLPEIDRALQLRNCEVIKLL